MAMLRCRTGLRTCSCNWRAARDALQNRLEQSQNWVDMHVPSAAPWRGLCWLTTSTTAGNASTSSYIQQFNRLITAARSGPTVQWSPGELVNLHEQVTGDPGWRHTVFVGRDGHVFPHPASVPTLVADACEEHRQTATDSYLAAMSFHLDLLTISPFAWANGAIARLVAAAQLAQMGLKSTLFTILDQQFLAGRSVYDRLLQAYWSGALCRNSCLNGLLMAAVARTHFVMVQQAGPAPGAEPVVRSNPDLAEIVDPLLAILAATDHQVDQHSLWSAERADQISRWEIETASHHYFGEPFLATARVERDLVRLMASAPLPRTDDLPAKE